MIYQMEVLQNILADVESTSNPDANPVNQVTQLTQHGQEDREPQASCKSNSDGQESRTGDYIMEPRIPEESASSSNYSTHQLNTSTSDTHQLYDPSASKQQQCNQYSVTPKRQRMESSREVLNEKAQHLIDEINEKRKADTILLADFKKTMELQVASSCGLLEQSMYQMYEHNGKIMQAKLQELFATLDRIAKLEVELQQFKHALGALYTDINPS